MNPRKNWYIFAAIAGAMTLSGCNRVEDGTVEEKPPVVQQMNIVVPDESEDVTAE